MANATEECEVKICEVGGEGLFLPLFGDAEQVWPSGLRGFLYLIGLLWTFIGVAIVADVFMSSIETITSKKKRVVDPKTGRNYTSKVWNETVSNLTLMALGSSAPEILLSIIELVGDSFFSGSLGPSTIVGSAAFNLLVISAVCVAAIPSPEVRYIKEVPVFAITASFSIIAYLWLLLIVVVISKDVVDVWEGLVTFAMFPILVLLAFMADKGWFSRDKSTPVMTKGKTTKLFDDMTLEELQKAEMKLQKEYGMELSDEEVAKLLAKDIDKHKSKAAYRVGATHALFGGKRVPGVGEKAPVPPVALKSVVPTDAPSPKGGAAQQWASDHKTTIEFVSKNVAVSESIGTVKLRVKRSGDLGDEVKVKYETQDGVAKAGMDYVQAEGVLVFPPQIKEQEIQVDIVDDAQWEEDEEFYVILSSPEGCGIGDASRVRIVIIDDDGPGVAAFEQDVYEIQEEPTDQVLQVCVKRTGGSAGTVSCKFTTEAGSATQEYDYLHTEGILTFEESVTSKEIPVTIKPKGRINKEEFRLILSEPENGLVFDAQRDGGPDQSIATIVVLPNEMAKSRLDRVTSLLRINRDRAALGAANWKEQLWNAILVNGGDEEEKPTVYDWVMHVISVFWKVIFALIPPPDYCGGWACFFCSLGMIGLVTALVADLAGLLGCVVGMGDAITAITLVALGTSLPDTFASKTAAQQDPYADASIGNITGSNSVNVFLGLGLPWSIGAIYWAAVGQTNEWREKYAKETRIDFASLEASGVGKFVVVGGDLGFSVGLFTGLAVLCIIALIARRMLFGGELGGPQKPKLLTAAFMVLLWLIYVIVSAVNIISNKGPCD